MIRRFARTALLSLSAGWCLPAAADYYDGLRAFDAGDYAAAVSEWQAEAEGGHGEAAMRLGRMYEKGEHIPQNFVRAHFFYNLAAAAGQADGIAAREAIAERMTREELGRARLLVEEKGLTGAPKPAAAAAKAPEQVPAAGRKPPSTGVARFDGLWEWMVVSNDGFCSVTFGPPARVENGRFRTQIFHPQDTSLAPATGTIDADGKIRGSAFGSFVSVAVTGRIEGDTARGRAEAEGESSCELEWLARRIGN